MLFVGETDDGMKNRRTIAGFFHHTLLPVVVAIEPTKGPFEPKMVVFVPQKVHLNQKKVHADSVKKLSTQADEGKTNDDG